MTTDLAFTFRGGERWRSPWDSYRRLRNEHPALLVEIDGRAPFYVLSRFEDVFGAARDAETFSSAQGLTPDVDAMAMFEDRAAPMVMMDPPDHTSVRRLIGRPMTPSAVASLRPAITEFVNRRLDFVGDSGGEIDIIEALFKPLPSFVVAHFLGVPVEDRGRFDDWSGAIVAASASGDVLGAPEAAGQLFSYANELIARRKVDPGDDLISLLVEAGEQRVSTEWIVGFVFTMVTGGNDTTTGLLGGAAELLSERPDQRQVLLDDPNCILGAVDEFLRLTSPVQNLARTTTRPLTLHDRSIPSGSKVLLLYGAANRDDREFGEHADEPDVRRNIRRLVSFGYGPHHCVGAAAARLTASIAIERLLARFPCFAVDAERGRFAPGAFVRRYESLPFTTSDS